MNIGEILDSINEFYRGRGRMKQYEVNKYVLKISWIYLLLWVLASSAIIILLAMGSPYWFFPMPGFVFLYLWLMIVSLYPKELVIGENDIAITMMGSNKVKIITLTDLHIEEKGGYYELAVASNRTGRKYLVSTKSIPQELEQLLRRLMEQS